MAILTYEDETDSREANVIKFEIPDDMNIHEFKIVCARLAAALGYSDRIITKSFGNLDYETEDDRFFKQIFDSIKSKSI